MCEAHLASAMVLDVGCGEGFCARRFLQMGAERVVGIDISDEMIARAKASASPNEHYLVGDATALRNTILK